MINMILETILITIGETIKIIEIEMIEEMIEMIELEIEMIEERIEMIELEIEMIEERIEMIE